MMCCREPHSDTFRWYLFDNTCTITRFDSGTFRHIKCKHNKFGNSAKEWLTPIRAFMSVERKPRGGGIGAPLGRRTIGRCRTWGRRAPGGGDSPSNPGAPGGDGTPRGVGTSQVAEPPVRRGAVCAPRRVAADFWRETRYSVVLVRHTAPASALGPQPLNQVAPKGPVNKCQMTKTALSKPRPRGRYGCIK